MNLPTCVACEQCGNVVGGRSLVFAHIVPHFNVFLFACFFFAVVVFIIVVMCSYDVVWILVGAG